MPDDAETARARQRTGTGIGLLLVLVLGAALLIALPDDESPDDDTACRARTVRSWQADDGLTAEFARYGDDTTRTDDWTGGDGTHSVRLPDGRVLWLFSDTYLGRVYGPPNPAGESHAWRDTTAPLVRNSAVLMRDGRLETTLPAPLFADPAPNQWRWPVAARVEPRSPGSSEQVVRVLLWVRTAGQAPWIYGVPTATEVATLSLPDLRLESVVKVLDQQLVPDPSRRVLFGTTLVEEDGWTYVYGGDDGQAASRPASHAYVARVPEGRLGDPAAWRYWTGSSWAAAARPRPVLGDGQRRGVGSAFSVVRDGGTYVLFTMAAGTKGLTTVASYWACSPAGPWHGPAKEFSPSLPQGQVAAYNPQAHPVLSGAGRLVLSYDVNWLETTGAAAQLSRNVSLYRPRFVTLRLAPAR
ncbi:DUF4185 domain-containing protein [Streptomyces coeruleorubidus]|uniref:DUF4185 domain-containing protein n=1 Tax=Streptomyces coeruleorubidus TaxID=116188 RepID=A0A5J6IA20_STRC4|nr:DUF4185 domain-containing protein [Streptomyces coeruleorubidus]QEV29009.1 DUF4185 domain-containing protein [Streptomyces coeruleorubidus]GGT72078.1 hypothetical protein GCM10010256_33050 [Streptomyces coeruleorubidus]